MKLHFTTLVMRFFMNLTPVISLFAVALQVARASSASIPAPGVNAALMPPHSTYALLDDAPRPRRKADDDQVNWETSEPDYDSEAEHWASPMNANSPAPHKDSIDGASFLWYWYWKQESTCGGPWRVLTSFDRRPYMFRVPSREDDLCMALDKEVAFKEYREIIDSEGERGLPESYRSWRDKVNAWIPQPDLDEIAEMFGYGDDLN
ncbi:hypothetical protein BJ508DRAFT_326157 [Ascobolus immersus RN42]|uniref:WW domain-containing protein n=1 Tax=Ascobolus immersus RN42 TaxID=1160509 RepID=A0A3N4I895_ASCIM|nr:hypothetical protein BJ508DRAFT_326157 [Ascobolus immersus RN42]